jgi:hypothetical protein
MNEPIQQNPDGSWSAAGPLGWQGGPDWEVKRTSTGGRAEFYNQDVLLSVVESRWRPVLAARMSFAARRFRRA